jgi:hypothetical protein
MAAQQQFCGDGIHQAFRFPGGVTAGSPNRPGKAFNQFFLAGTFLNHPAAGIQV